MGNDMYDDDEGNDSDPRPLSFAPSQQESQLERKASRFSDSSNSSTSDAPIPRSRSGGPKSSHHSSPTEHTGRPRQVSTGSLSNGAPDLSRASSTDTATAAFPLNDIDYESSPAAVAQELSNLQAIRRMSMNVDAADPDLPSFSSGISLPSVAPSATSDEDDTARLFWVPARLHPELAPKDYKSFVEDRVERIKRRSEDEEPPSPSSLGRSSSSDSSKVDRRKSMLSRTVEVASDLKDGADVLDRRRSNHRRGPSAETSLQELEALVSDPSSLMRKMSLDQSRRSVDSDPDMIQDEDMPMLPTSLGSTLKRSTRTQYNRRGSLRSQGRLGRRGTQRVGSQEESEQPAGAPPLPRLQQTSTEPEAEQPVIKVPSYPQPPATAGQAEGISQGRERPDRPESPRSDKRRSREPPASAEDKSQQVRPFHSKIASHGRTTAQLPGYSEAANVPQIVEPGQETKRPSSQQLPPGSSYPERRSSHGFNRVNSTPSNRSSTRPTSAKQAPSQSIDDMANNPALMPGTNTSTDAVSFIPTLQEEKKPEKDRKSKKDAGESSARKGSWGWLLGSEDRKREDKEEKESKKSRSKNKSADKSHDSARLDLLQTVTEGPRSSARESLVLDRDSTDFRLEEERKKTTSSRKAGGEKKEPGILSSLFGVAKKTKDRDSGSGSGAGGAGRRQGGAGGLSPEPPRRLLLPDIDYNWTRFSILEERAIYRMAHIKLANPRRPLHSQVLLSNFMYSYLAKVQQMHPQMGGSGSYGGQGKGNGKQQQQKESDEFSQWQRYQEVSVRQEAAES